MAARTGRRRVPALLRRLPIVNPPVEAPIVPAGVREEFPELGEVALQRGAATIVPPEGRPAPDRGSTDDTGVDLRTPDASVRRVLDADE